MDIISHGFWSIAAARAAEPKLKKRLNLWLVAWWGAFPDLFAFTIPFIWIFAEFVSGGISFRQLPPPHEGEPPAFASNLRIFNLASSLYNVSHSLFIFIVAFVLTYLFLKRISWEMLAWLLHILIDIPTHSYKFFPTPLFWPFSTWKFLYGFSWGQLWFLILDYSALLIVFLIQRKVKRPLKIQENI